MRRWLGLVAGVVAVAVLATAAPADAVPIWTRIADGTDRFDTAVKLSFAMFPTPPVDSVFVASGEQFPDALAAGAVAAAAPGNGGPVLLTQKDTLPDVTKAELDRLNPNKIVLVGGTGAVSDAVQTALAAYGTVTRVMGANRFETSAALSSAAFPTGAPVAYVGTGVGSFADALSGSAAAGSEGGPVLLVETHGIPAAVGTELDRLNPSKIVVLGGVQAVGPEVQVALQPYAPNVQRVQGVDRYATSAAVSAATFAVDRPFVFVVTGDAFPDGLAAGAIGGGRDVPVLLTRKSCMPQVIATELTRLNPGQVYIVGGTGAIVLDDQNRQPVCA